MNIKQYVFKYDIDQFLLLNKLYVLLLCFKKKNYLISLNC